MSRLTRTPFHKPSPFDIPRPVHPLSPPGTEVTGDSVQLPPMNFVSRDSSSYADMGASSSFTRVDTPEAYQPSAQDTQTANRQFRRPSNLSYLHSGSFRTDLRAPRSATRWLVMVSPPPAVSREYGTGVFLNASARMSQVVLLPLLPSLSGQLSAIAREFSFPSTTGICIYLQMSDGGIQFAPRISDESWSILWGSAFDERQTMNTMGGLPIVGRVEFDLDLRKARWFDMWLTSQRHAIDLGISAPVSVAAHHREESRTMTTFDHGEDSAADDISVTIQHKRPAVRHIPRKLSLLDRIDVSTLKPNVRSASRLALSPTDAEQPHFVLSPVAPDTGAVSNVEDGEPETAKQSVVNVQKKVQSWRASSSFPKSPALVSNGQTALDPVNMPNNQPLVEPSAGVIADGSEPLNLDDFTWSISSAGPLSADFYVPSLHPEDGDRPPSVHLDSRLEGSVCLTPTTCTSFGPPDYDIVSPVGSFISRLPSPDIAERQFEDSLPTPSTATSWGAPLEWPDSPASVFRAPSVDIAARHFESRPVTPSTATSWGAPWDCPDSPAPSFRAPSVDLAERHFGSRPVTPSTATSWGAPVEWPPSPARFFYVHTPGAGNMFFDDGHEESALLDRGRTLRYSAPDDDKKPRWSSDEDANETQSSMPWQFVWPYRQVSTEDSPAFISVRLQSTYPRISLYPVVYPHFDLYPASSAASGDQTPQKRVPRVYAEVSGPRNGALWKFVWPYRRGIEEDPHSMSTRLAPGYPSIDPYPAVYPHFDLYPAKPAKCGSSREANTKLGARYPTLCIYPAIYPAFEIYPGQVIEAQKNSHEGLSVHLKPVYPSIGPYPAVYPFFDLYPASSLRVQGAGRQPPRRPNSQSHRNSAVSRKAAPWKHVWPYQHVVGDAIRPVTTRLEFVYPSLGLYPAVYPHFELYPAKPLAVGTTRDISFKLEARYPNFSIYSAVYPSFEIYPGHIIETQKNPSELFSVKLSPSYPSFEIYAPVYPHLVIYPENVTEEKRSKVISYKVQESPQTALKRSSNAKQQIKVTLEPVYPQLEIYPPVYPHLRVYPSLPSSQLDNTVSNLFDARYPDLIIYPAVYPFFDIYRSGKASTPEYWREEIPVVLDAKYPTFSIYPVVYPSFDIYRTGSISNVLTNNLSTKLEAVYPAFDIYPVVYPHFELYPFVQLVKQDVPFVCRARKTHQQLVDLASAQPARSAPRVSTVPRIYISSHDTRSRARRSHKELVELVFPKSRGVSSRVRSSVISTDVPRDVNRSSNSPKSARPSGIPTRPSEFRRSNSLGHATMSSSFKSSPSTSGVARSGSLRQLPLLREGASVSNADLQQSTHVLERRHTKRDSIVLERARHWGAPVVTSGPKPSPLARETSPVTDLSEFPMPPLPPIPRVPGARPLSSVNRSVAKLDKTKFPFR